MKTILAFLWGIFGMGYLIVWGLGKGDTETLIIGIAAIILSMLFNISDDIDEIKEEMKKT